MRIFDQYMARRFTQPFLFGLGIFSLLIFLGDLFDKMPKLIKSSASLWVIVQWLWLDVPYWAIRVIPMATLLATLYAVTSFIRSGEWIAMQASGLEPRRILRPLLMMSAIVTGLSFAAQETILPACYSRAEHLWRDQIHPEWEWDTYQDVMLVAGPGLFLTAAKFTVKDGKIVWPVLDYYRNGRIAQQVVAKEAQWDGAAHRWVFMDAVTRQFKPDGVGIEETRSSRLVTEIETPPKELVPRSKDPDSMSLAETLKYLRQVRMLGGSSREAWTAFYAKIAYPFSNLILCALGVPIALKLRRSSKVLSFGAALALSFLYLWVMEMGRALGVAGRLPEPIGAWMANVLFGGAAYWAQRRVEF